MILYDIKKELFPENYKPLPERIQNFIFPFDSVLIEQLTENLYQAAENAFLNGSDLLLSMLYDDIITIQKYRIEQYIKTISSGSLARIIDSASYIETDKAAQRTMQNLQSSKTENTIFLDMGTDPANIEKFIKKSYEEGK